MFKFQGRGHNDNSVPSLPLCASIACTDEAVNSETASIVNEIDDDVPGDGDVPNLAPCATPEGINDNEDIGGIPHRK